MKELKGIDVSTLQGDIDWKRVRAAGIDFAMIKATQGRGEGVETRKYRKFRDTKFVDNITGAAAAGIACGVYHYFTAKNIFEAREEAAYFLATIKPHRDKIELWAAVDVESAMWLKNVDKPTLTKAVREFIDKVSEAGYKPMLYTNLDFLTYRYEHGAFADTEKWFAYWKPQMIKTVPNVRIWQYGIDDVDGIRFEVDANKGYFEIPAVSAQVPVYVVGNLYRIKTGDRYTSGLAVPSRLVGEAYRIAQVKPGRIRLDVLNSWIKV